ncbi:valine--pyruvate transaminase [Gilvimarinus agarilyticus]|uniref:valine--pyruvate transaminase n=1 Tax=unclassified Gilvimarinus TaxID=2642066 RepID=UPI001C096F6C|nr:MULTISPECIES: valine--pyruvate transaminase [unclassified Gilvimarinus]MBU2887389.1 valine--pyruvate transaminase [Gilvimarinus agarilyticus]MDO6572048.1 valine--pyruvate transaminase [Gilvimarinus sp. 2_MG-2023]MDO6746108.1 valine--pyruvate transaminase [Gilvimarinus sp. 1_MG-2023]
MQFSEFGQRLTAGSGIVSLMDDLGTALRENPDMLFLGGGNPARIEAVESLLSDAARHVLDQPERAHEMFGVYQSPAGDLVFRKSLAEHLNQQFEWGVGAANIALANGSQSAFFTLFNLLAGRHSDGSNRQIQLPLVPEYLGYSELGLTPDFFHANRPSIERLSEHEFKYHLDLDSLTVEPNSAALCVSRPTNPTGNMIGDTEMAALDRLAQSAAVPLIIDGAYGLPFPGIVFTEASCRWNDNTILVLSLSKLGFPGARTSIVIAAEPLIEAFAKANTVISLAAGNIGPAVAHELLKREQLLAMGRQSIAPFYQQRCHQAVQVLQRALAHLPYRLHKPEGAIFLWLWFEGLPITSQALYERLKAKGVLVIAGEHFFPGLTEPWRHRYECIRLSYAQPADVIERAAQIIAQEVTQVYEQDG